MKYYVSKGKVQGNITLAEKISQLTANDIKAAVTRKKHRIKPNYSNPGDQFLSTISTACIPFQEYRENGNAFSHGFTKNE